MYKNWGEMVKLKQTMCTYIMNNTGYSTLDKQKGVHCSFEITTLTIEKTDTKREREI